MIITLASCAFNVHLSACNDDMSQVGKTKLLLFRCFEITVLLPTIDAVNTKNVCVTVILDGVFLLWSRLQLILRI